MERKQCVHIYVRTKGSYKKGERCNAVGRLDVDNEYRCYRHRYSRYVIFHKQRKQAYVATRIERMRQRIQKLAGEPEKNSFVETIQGLIASIP
jgi:hypothetical protein